MTVKEAPSQLKALGMPKAEVNGLRDQNTATHGMFQTSQPAQPKEL